MDIERHCPAPAQQRAFAYKMRGTLYFVSISYLCFIERGCISLLVSHNKIQQTEWFKQQKPIFLQFLRFEVQSQGASKFGLQMALLAHDSFLSVFSFSLCV